jgi:hypothetical protein
MGGRSKWENSVAIKCLWEAGVSGKQYKKMDIGPLFMVNREVLLMIVQGR